MAQDASPAGRDAADTPARIAFTSAIERKGGHAVPQTIGHRGYKAKYPENTMLSFKRAIEAGAHAVETDIHLTKDDVVVLSHDGNLERCFGSKEKIIDLEWAQVSEMRTLAEPPQPMARLIDLLEFLAQPEQEDIWLLLDIKIDNNNENVMRQIASTIASAPSPRPWAGRIVLGLWATRFIPLAAEYLPEFPIAFTGFSIAYAGEFFAVPHAGFNVLFSTLVGLGGAKFLRRAKKEGRPVWAWTVNRREKIDWCIRKRLDGIITDDPELTRKVVDEYDENKPAMWWGPHAVWETVWFWIMLLFMSRSVLKKIDGPKTKYRY